MSPLKFREPQPQDNLFDSHYYGVMVPDDEELMQIDRHVDFSFVLAEVRDCYTGVGRPPLNPEMMLRLCFLKEYANESDADLERKLRYNLLYRKFLHLGGNLRPPDATSLSVFRERLGEARLKACLERVVEGAVALGLVQGERVHVDSTGIVADVTAPRLRNLILEALEPAVEALTTLGVAEEGHRLELERAALAADSMYWETKERRDAHVLACWELLGRVGDLYDDLMRRGDWTEPQSALILQQAALVEKVLQRQASGQSGERRDLLVSTHDPDARWSNREKGKKPFPGYKEHLVEDDASGVITGVIVTPANVDDSTQLQGLVDAHEANVGALPESLGGDAKYHSGDNREFLDEQCVEAFIAVPAAKGEKQGMYSPADFEYDAEHDCVMCPAGEIAEGGKWDEKAQGSTYYFCKAQCEGCPLRAQCSECKRGRTVFISKHRDIMLAARREKDSPEQVAGQRRRLRVERTFSLQKLRHGLRRTRYRGLERVSAGVYMNIIMVNIRRIVKHLVAEEERGQPPRRLLARAA